MMSFKVIIQARSTVFMSFTLWTLISSLPFLQLFNAMSLDSEQALRLSFWRSRGECGWDGLFSGVGASSTGSGAGSVFISDSTLELEASGTLATGCVFLLGGFTLPGSFRMNLCLGLLLKGKCCFGYTLDHD